MSDVERLDLDRILVFAGITIAILLAPVIFIWSIISGPIALSHSLGKGIGIIGQALFKSTISVVFGFILLWTFTKMNKFPRNAYIIGLICSVLLILLGGISGGLGGLVALIGFIIYMLKVEGVIDKKWPKS